ncbi:hypothetical protein [Streptomyces sp. NRRL WC-3725]|uniref:hypothetical protein n=1 Tax=Streptomyces sp. NRRL WC-3725 TaxID=1463933 RepID=UPI0004C54798|nr:hypothetical protein [Streptomyces sp. NRRL WC-3725]
MDKLIELFSTLASGTVIAVLPSWLTSRAHNRQEQQAGIRASRVQVDAMTMMKPHGTAATNRLLWEGPAEHGRTFLLTVLAFADGAARARIAGGTDVRSGPVRFGRAAEPPSWERVTSRQTASAVREPAQPGRHRRHPPLKCCSYPAVVTATEQLLNAVSDTDGDL